MPEIVVAIPTFRRPQRLERLLRALAALDTGNAPGILVADNDCVAHQGFDLCSRLVTENYRWNLDSTIVAERGIAQVRNVLVGRAFLDPATRFIAMLDDDEWPEPQWLEAMLCIQSRTGADVIRGSVLREFEVSPPDWATGWEGVAPIWHAAGSNAVIEGIGNVLMGRQCFEALSQPYFDPQFGLTGGEDRDFFVRLRALGMRFARAENAIVYEYVPATRLRLGWSLLRAYRTGNSDMRIALKYKRGLGDVIREVAKILAALLAFPLLSIVFSMKPSRRLDGVRKLYRAAGKIGALLGHRYYEYAVPHRR